MKLETRVAGYPAFAVAVLAIALTGTAPAVPVGTMQSKPESDLDAVLELAAYFQDDYSKKLPVIAAFRRWRGGHLSTEAFLKRLGEDDLADVLRIEPVAPMRGLALLNDHRQSKR